jgi:SAM-dependent methyltransferase
MTMHLTAPATAAGESARWERVLMRALYDPFLWTAERLGMAGRRRRLLAHARGDVLEIGAGTGLNARHYPDAVEQLVVTEPIASLVPRIERRLRGAGRAASVVAAPAEALPVADASVDTVVSTMVLCTVDDVPRSLAEIRRILRPGGRLLFVEHVRADDGWRARAQDRVHRPWRAFAGGCNCNLPTLELLREAGFAPDRLERARWRGMPFCVKPLVVGSATVT